MRKLLIYSLLCLIFLLSKTVAFCSTFDERLWEKYAELETISLKNSGSLAGVYLEPYQFGDVTAKNPFADLRIVTEQKEEVPWQIVSRKPEKLKEELHVEMRNLSQTEKGETWLELLIDKQSARINAVEIVTPDTDFSRQVEVLGSPDGKSWNTIRKDGVIFDINRGEKLHHTRITFTQTNFRYIALKIANGGAQPLTIANVKVFQETDTLGQTYTIQGNIGKPEINTSRKESSIILQMNMIFPVDRLSISTTDRNFQRVVEVQINRGNGEWEFWAQGTVFSFDTPTMHELQLSIDIPEVATKEFRLVFKNLDSPPLSIIGVNGEAYRKVLVFKQQADRKLYLFWGNPLAQQPQYDLAGLIAKQKIDELPMVYFSKSRINTKFAGNNARLPFTERYKYLLYIVVSIAIAGLIFVQFRVFRRIEE